MCLNCCPSDSKQCSTLFPSDLINSVSIWNPNHDDTHRSRKEKQIHNYLYVLTFRRNIFLSNPFLYFLSSATSLPTSKLLSIHGQLSIIKGDILLNVISEDKSVWWMETFRGETSLFPYKILFFTSLLSSATSWPTSSYCFVFVVKTIRR